MHQDKEGQRQERGDTQAPDAFQTGVQRGVLEAAQPEKKGRFVREVQGVQADLWQTGGGQQQAGSVVEVWEEGRHVDGRYCLVGLAGRGGMGEVWKAWDVQGGQWVALKRLHAGGCDDGALRRLAREAWMLRSLAHPGIVQMREVALAGGYLAMEWLEGETLRARLRRVGRLPLAESLVVMRQVSEALERAHDAGVAHLDLKPENLFLCRVPDEKRPLDGQARDRLRVKLLDFGLARLVGQKHSTMETSGTAYYIAPERLQGGCRGTLAADIYGLGVLLYECLLGRVPTAGAAGIAAQFLRWRREERLMPEDCPQELRHEVEGLWQALQCLYEEAVCPVAHERAQIGGFNARLAQLEDHRQRSWQRGVRLCLQEIQRVRSQQEELRKALLNARRSYPEVRVFRALWQEVMESSAQGQESPAQDLRAEEVKTAGQDEEKKDEVECPEALLSRARAMAETGALEEAWQLASSLMDAFVLLPEQGACLALISEERAHFAQSLEIARAHLARGEVRAMQAFWQRQMLSSTFPEAYRLLWKER